MPRRQTALRVVIGQLGTDVRLDYLAPAIITSMIDATQPQGLMSLSRMQNDIPMDWT